MTEPAPHPFTIDLMNLFDQHFPNARDHREQAEKMWELLSVALGAAIGGASARLQLDQKECEDIMVHYLRIVMASANQVHASIDLRNKQYDA